MAAVYLRTLDEAIEDGLLCAEPCEHIDCAEWRRNVDERCTKCGERASGQRVFIEDGGFVHMLCVLAEVTVPSGGR